MYKNMLTNESTCKASSLKPDVEISPLVETLICVIFSGL